MEKLTETTQKIIINLHEENAQLKARIAELEENLGRFRASLCEECGGVGFVGNPPDDYYDCPTCVKRHNKIKADDIREAGRSAIKYLDKDGEAGIMLDNLNEFAANLEGGKL